MISAGVVWPASGVRESAAALARRSGFADSFETEPIIAAFPDVPRRLRIGAPVIVRVPDGLLAIRRVGRYHMTVITPDDRRCRLSTSAVLEAAATVESAVATEVDEVLDLAGLRSGRNRRFARTALLDACLVDHRVDAGWAVRPLATAPWRQLVRSASVGRWITVLVLAQLATYALFLAAFSVVGGAAARGDLRPSTVTAGLFILFAAVPLRMLGTWSAGAIAMTVGCLFKRRLQAGIVAVDPDEMRQHGAGYFLALILEAEAVEALALTGGYTGLIAVVELIAAVVALGAGVRAPALIGLLALWILLAVVLARKHFRRRLVWTDARATLTGTLVEQMAGHRTRVAQEGASLYDTSADETMIDEYDHLAIAMDAPARWLRGGLVRGWVVAGLAAAVVGTDGIDPALMAASIGGVLLAFHALDGLVTSATSLTDATIAWRRVSFIMRPRLAPTPPDPTDVDVCGVDVCGVDFEYGQRSILRNVNLTIEAGDRVLIEGPSGAGKSTLAALIGGLRQPSTGTITGTGGVGVVPQFHENHILSASLAFNLLLGRQWPPSDDDLVEAWQVCEELGLGDLLARMPAGIEQPVGECGWQLSHGERSRIFVARALLQRAPVIVLDESFAALDPAALRQTVQTVLRRTRTMIAIAHE